MAHLDQVIPTQLEDLVETMFLISGKNLPPQGIYISTSWKEKVYLGGWNIVWVVWNLFFKSCQNQNTFLSLKVGRFDSFSII